MKLTYDPARNVAYVRLREPAGAIETLRLSDDVLLDMAPDGTLCGIELLNANEQLGASDDGRVVVVDPVNGTERSLPVAGLG